MSAFNTQRRFGSLAIALHWLTVLAIVVAYASMEFKGLAPKGAARDLVKSVHFCAGLAVLGMAVLRLALYLRGPLPLITPRPPQWQERIARWTHRGLYLFLLLMPVLGWLIFSARGAAVPLPLPLPLPLSGVELPPLPLPALLSGKEVAHSFKEVHETVANVGYALIGLHAAAALFHHYVLHDDTLTRMLPQRH